MLGAYFAAREQEVAYRATKHRERARDAHVALIPALEAFLAVAGDEAAVEILDRVIFRALRQVHRLHEGEELVEACRRLDPDGFDLLALTPPLDFDSLKRAYRAAALRHHPDRGGSSDAMGRINAAYGAFHALVCRYQLWSEAAADAECARENAGLTAERYVAAMSLVLAQAHFDEWSPDRAWKSLTWMDAQEWLCPRVGWRDLDPGRHVGFLARLAGRLGAAGLHLEAKECLARAETLRMAGRVMDPDALGDLSDARAVIVGRKRLRVVLTHLRQADNALRIGVIDLRRHRAARARFERRGEAVQRQENRLSAFVAGGGFALLPSDSDPPERALPFGTLVPEPAYGEVRLDGLTWMQRAQYALAFSAAASVPLVQKYRFVRLDSLLRAAVLWHGRLPAELLLAEIFLLRDLGPARDGGREYFDAVAALVRFLDGLDVLERYERLRVLELLDEVPGGRWYRVEGFRVVERGGRSTWTIRADPAWCALAKKPLAQLQRTLRRVNPDVGF